MNYQPGIENLPSDDEWSTWRGHPQAPATGTQLCRVAEIADGSARVVAFGGGWRGLEIVVVRAADTVQAYVNVCPHVALPLNIDSRVSTQDRILFCDQHGAAFRFDDGSCISGPCVGTSLESVAVVVRDGGVIVADDPIAPTGITVSEDHAILASSSISTGDTVADDGG